MSSAAAIVRAIRGAKDEGEEFDLAGSFTEQMSRDLIKAAFGEALPADKPLKFTFIVGGGRLVRSRYDTELPKWLTGELRALGYDDDRGASLGSQGAYKRQHDVDANLEYLHVFPKLAAKATGGGGAPGASGAAGGDAGAPALDRESPEFLVVACSLAQLQRLVASRVGAYAGKKRLLKLLQDWDARLEGMDTKMMTTAQPLSDSEQAVYDVTTREALQEKAAWLQGEMKAQVAAGKLTGGEKERVLAGMDDKLTQAKAEAAAAAAGGQAKKAEKLQEAMAALAARRAALAASAPIVHPVKGDVDMRKCEIGMANCDKLKANIAKAGRLATLAEARELGARSDHEAKLASLRAEARAWFESDEELDERVKAAMRAIAAKMRR